MGSRDWAYDVIAEGGMQAAAILLPLHGDPPAAILLPVQADMQAIPENWDIPGGEQLEIIWWG